MAMPKPYLIPKFSLEALLTLASSLRNRPCTCDMSKPPMSGSMNWAIIVTFDDGVDWILRSPHSGIRAVIDETYACKMLASEAATIRYIRSHTSVPVPEVFAFRYDDNRLHINLASLACD